MTRAGRRPLVVSFALLGLASAQVSLPPPHDRTTVTFLQRPDYDLTTDAGDAQQLMDGKTIAGTMWLSRQAVGWVTKGRPVSFEIDGLNNRSSQHLCLHVGQRPSADAFLPRSIDVFTKDRNEGWIWLGGAFPRANTDQADTQYSAENICVRLAPAKFLNLRVVVLPRDPYFFLDEISLAKPIGAAAISPVLRAAVSNAESFALSRLSLREEMRKTISRAHAPGGEQISALMRKLDDGSIGRSEAELSDLIRDVGVARIADQTRPVRIVAIDPFSAASSSDFPDAIEPPSLLLLQRQTAVGAVSFVTRSTAGARLQISLSVRGAAAGAFTTQLFALHTLVSANGRQTADPLIPIKGQLEIMPGHQQAVFATISADRSVLPGNYRAELNARDLVSGQRETITWPLEVRKIDRPKEPGLLNAWAYGDRPPFTIDAARAARQASQYGVNVGVIPATLMPWPERQDNGRLLNDYRAFDAAVDRLADTRRILLFLGFKGKAIAESQRFGVAGPAFGPEWHDAFGHWFRALIAHLEAKGIRRERIAIYPVDEPANAFERDQLKFLSQLIRNNAPGVDVYTTLRVLEGFDQSLLDAVDILQLDDVTFDRRFAAKAASAGKEVWLYRAEGGGKAADPALTYRALAWRAFVNGLGGFGAWSYTQNDADGSVFNDLDGSQIDYAMIYPVGGDWYSSRRWEAFRLAAQDFELLRAAWERAGGKSDRLRLIDLANKGIAAQHDPGRLESIRREVAALAEAD